YFDTMRRLISAAPRLEYDGHTGEPDRTVIRDMRKRIAHELCEAQGCDAVLYPDVEKRPALFYNVEARWNGASQFVNGPKTAEEANAVQTKRMVGTIPAVSLQVRILDLDLNPLYYGIGGIEIRQLVVNGQFQKITEDRWYGYPERDSIAVRLAL